MLNGAVRICPFVRVQSLFHFHEISPQCGIRPSPQLRAEAHGGTSVLCVLICGPDGFELCRSPWVLFSVSPSWGPCTPMPCWMSVELWSLWKPRYFWPDSVHSHRSSFPWALWKVPLDRMMACSPWSISSHPLVSHRAVLWSFLPRLSLNWSWCHYPWHRSRWSAPVIRPWWRQRLQGRQWWNSWGWTPFDIWDIMAPAWFDLFFPCHNLEN